MTNAREVRSRWLLAVCAVLVGTLGSLAHESVAAEQTRAPLPPVIDWHGKSLGLVVEADDPWATPFEQSGLTRTPRYAETVAWLERLAEASPELQVTSIGRSPEGREIVMLIASREGAATPEALRASGKPVLLAQAGIHSGEIDGKDAGMMLLRDITVRGSKHELLDHASLLFVPILSVDAHERFSAFSRINQRGPEQMGWRTNARNLNLNRDYAKLDTPELRALVLTLGQWQPDLYFDIHVTDGIDYQYDITFGYNGDHGYSPAIAGWLDGTLRPRLESDLEAQGHIPGPLVFAVDPTDVSRGIVGWTALPRFSNGYGDATHLPTVLVENHSLKPVVQRVLGTYVLLESALRALGEHAESLRQAVAADRERRSPELALEWRVPQDRSPAKIEFLGVESRRRRSEAAGGDVVEWTGKPVTLQLPLLTADEPTSIVKRPRAYWIPAAWPEVIERLRVHGVELERLAAAREVNVELTRLAEPQLAEAPFEGRMRVTATLEPFERREIYPPGSARVSTDQPLGDLAMLLLEPGSADSFFQWGFFLEVLQRTEYGEEYVLAPLGERLLASDAKLKRAFEAKLAADPEFAEDSRARLQWLYARTPYFDERWRVYPIGREW